MPTASIKNNIMLQRLLYTFLLPTLNTPFDKFLKGNAYIGSLFLGIGVSYNIII